MLKEISINTQAFFEIIRAGLWERECCLAQYGTVDFQEIYRLAEEQTVLGLVTAGLEHLSDYNVTKDELLQFIGLTLQLEQRNNAMNSFIAYLVDKMRQSDIYTLLVKGQGVAHCYERPLWRAAGDIDFYLSNTNYEKAKTLLIPLANSIDSEDKGRLHVGMTIDSWVVELHGTMHTGISRRMNKVSDDVHYDIFHSGNVRSWNNNGVQVFLPSPNNDVIIVFNHFITHFYGEGIGLRQICDWCRLLWTYKDEIDHSLLQRRISKMGLMNEWRAFASLAVEWLGMPADAMPLYSSDKVWSKKACKIAELIIETGSFGSNKDNSYRLKNSKWKEYIITLSRRMGEFGRISTIFPLNSCKFFISYVFYRIKEVL